MRKVISPRLLFWFFAIALIACNSNARFHSQEKQLLQLADSIEIDQTIYLSHLMEYGDKTTYATLSELMLAAQQWQQRFDKLPPTCA